MLQTNDATAGPASSEGSPPEPAATVPSPAQTARACRTCRGRVQASSESLSHAAVYVNDPTARAVIHVHHLKRWEALRDRVPTTDHAAEAGTPQMAWAIEELFRKSGVKEGGFFVMGGHREGLMAFGPSVAEAAERLLRFVNAATEA